MRKFIYIFVLLFSVSSSASGYLMMDLGVDYVRQLSTARIQGLDQIAINTTLFGRISNNFAWEVSLRTHMYNLIYTTGESYKHTSLAYAVGLRFYIIDGFYIRGEAGGYKDFSPDADDSVADNQWTFGGGIGYVIPFPFLTFAKPFVNVGYKRLYADEYNMYYLGGGFIFIFF